MTLAFSAFDDRSLGLVLPIHAPHEVALPVWWQGAVVAVTILVLFLRYRPALNLVSRLQLMNFSFEPFHLVNTYGAFGSVTKQRFEIVVEGKREGDWLAYEFKGKPGDPARRPRQFAPYHLRLDWLMWFAAMESPWRHQWFVALLVKLLHGDRATSRLLRRDPFSDRPPAVIRANLYLYRFTSREERRATRAWWTRTLVGDYVAPITLDAAGDPTRFRA